ncbi:Actin-like protein 6A, partial [Trichinella patagoniensis]
LNIMASIYGGDDVSALIFDPGEHSFRIGNGGDGIPKLNIAQVYGYLPKEVANDVTILADEMELELHTSCMNGNTMQSCFLPFEDDYRIGWNFVNPVLNDVEYVSLMKYGLIDNFDLLENIIQYASRRLLPSACDDDYPILFTEPPWNTRHHREELIERLFERFNVPAAYLAKTPALSTSVAGKGSAVVVDSGAYSTTATAVYETFCISKTCTMSSLAGNCVSVQCSNLLEKREIDVMSSLMASQTNRWSDSENLEDITWSPRAEFSRVTDSFMGYTYKNILDDMKMSLIRVPEKPFNPNSKKICPVEEYEFPNKAKHMFGRERFEIGESLFDVNYLKGDNLADQADRSMQIGNIINDCIQKIDIDVRSEICKAIVITGGNSLIPGFTNRVGYEVSKLIWPGRLPKIHVIPGSCQRVSSSWIGGSMLTSLGTFQQLWISKEQYLENGASVVQYIP